jgi:hypothetical protein
MIAFTFTSHFSFELALAKAASEMLCNPTVVVADTRARQADGRVLQQIFGTNHYEI